MTFDLRLRNCPFSTSRSLKWPLWGKQWQKHNTKHADSTDAKWTADYTTRGRCAGGQQHGDHQSEAGAVSLNRNPADLKHLVAALEEQADIRREDWDFQSVTLSCTTTSLSFSLPSTLVYPELVSIRTALFFLFLHAVREALRPPGTDIRHELLKVKAVLFLAICGFNCYHINFALSACIWCVWGGGVKYGNSLQSDWRNVYQHRSVNLFTVQMFERSCCQVVDCMSILPECILTVLITGEVRRKEKKVGLYCDIVGLCIVRAGRMISPQTLVWLRQYEKGVTLWRPDVSFLFIFYSSDWLSGDYCHQIMWGNKCAIHSSLVCF